MARLFIGRRTAGGGGLVRIMRNNADDPNTTPSTAIDKFVFDSETSDLGYATKAYVIPAGSPGYIPAGTGAGNCQAYRGNAISGAPAGTSYNLDWIKFYVQTVFGQGFPSYADFHGINPATGRYQFYGWYGDEDSGFGLYGYGLIGDLYLADDNYYGPDGRNHYIFFYNETTDGLKMHMKDLGAVKALVWTFPADETNFDPPSAPPQSGQKNVIISPSIVRIARPGFDVATATGRQLIADSDNIPAKLVRSGSIASIPAGGYVDIALGFSLPANTFLDGQFADAADPDFSIPGGRPLVSNKYDDCIVKVEYEFLNSNATLRIWNISTFAVKGRYAVFASGDGQTSGAGPVLRLDHPADPTWAQIVRPGAADPAHWDDVMIDTRLPYLPLLAHGYVDKASMATVTDGDEADNFGQKKWSITVNCPAGYVPFVKAMMKSQKALDASTNFHRYQKPFAEKVFDNSPTNDRAANTRRIKISGSAVTFYCSDTAKSKTIDSPNNIIQNGWVYYIFAVPATL